MCVCARVHTLYVYYVYGLACESLEATNSTPITFYTLVQKVMG